MYQEYALHHAPNMCLKHIPMPQQNAKGMTITLSTCNQDMTQTMCLKYVPTTIIHVPRDTIKHVPYHSYTIYAKYPICASNNVAYHHQGVPCIITTMTCIKHAP
jgi:hypothetical protein